MVLSENRFPLFRIMLYKPDIATFGAAINVSANAVTHSTKIGTKIGTSAKVAVIQVKRGIGDVIWHLPFIQAIAAVSTPAAKSPSSRRRRAAPSNCSLPIRGVAETIYFEHDGSEFKRAVNCSSSRRCCAGSASAKSGSSTARCARRWRRGLPVSLSASGLGSAHNGISSPIPASIRATSTISRSTGSRR